MISWTVNLWMIEESGSEIESQPCTGDEIMKVVTTMNLIRQGQMALILRLLIQ